MKTDKAVKRISQAEDLIAGVLERYSPDAPEIGQQLLDARAAVNRAREAVKLQAASEKTSARKKVDKKKAEVKVPPVKSTKKQRTTKRDYEG